MHGRKTVTGVRVDAPARLHLGFLDLNGSLGRRFGSIGLAVGEPSTSLEITRASAMGAEGPERERAGVHVQRLSEALGLTGTYHVKVLRAIPAHAGLGSGTQLAVSIGMGLSQLEGLNRNAKEIGELVDRGARSAIGIAAFEQGGFVFDGGKGASHQPPPVIAHVPFPESWRALLILDRNAVGVHGDRETKAFATLAPMPEAQAAHLCRIALMRLLPGLLETDLDAFGDGLTEVQEIVGSYFAAAQGGSAWSSPAVGRIARRMGEMGAKGIGQSSWGPTGFAFTASETAAARLYSSLVEEAKASGLEILIVRGRNAGARVDFI